MKNFMKIALLSCCLAGAVAHAAPPGSAAGTSSYKDASLTVGGTKDFSDQFALVLDQNINPIQSTAGFSGTFTNALTGTSTWNRAAIVDHGSLVDKLLGDGLTFSFSKTNDYSGTWSITNTNTSKNLTVDLVLSLHAGNGVGSFLFDNQVVKAGSTLQGNWAVNWINNANNPASIAKFSNMGIYTGVSSFTSPVPEPATYGMMLGGLALLGFAARRRKA